MHVFFIISGYTDRKTLSLHTRRIHYLMGWLWLCIYNFELICFHLPCSYGSWNISCCPAHAKRADALYHDIKTTQHYKLYRQRKVHHMFASRHSYTILVYVAEHLLLHPQTGWYRTSAICAPQKNDRATYRKPWTRCMWSEHARRCALRHQRWLPLFSGHGAQGLYSITIMLMFVRSTYLLTRSTHVLKGSRVNANGK